MKKVMKKVMDDPGHVGHDSGAVGPTGVQESVITLAVAKKVAEILKPIMEVKLTREEDRALGKTLNADLKDRADMANKWGADIFVSIHCNASENRSAHGCEIWTTPGQTGGDALAESVLQALRAEFPDITYRMDMTDGDSDKEARFAVLTQTRMPAALIELAFLSNPTEEAMLESLAYQDRAARAISEGIAAYLGVQLPVLAPSDPVANAVAVLQAAGIINCPDYWLEHGRPGKLADGQYVGQLLQATAKKIRSA